MCMLSYIDKIDKIVDKIVDKLVEYRGGVVPDAVLRHERRTERSKRPFEAHPDCKAVLDEL